MTNGDGFDHWLLFGRAAVEPLKRAATGLNRRLVRAEQPTRREKSYTECGDAFVSGLGRKTVTATVNALGHGRLRNGLVPAQKHD